jgi:MscS family membrane protein
MFTDTRWTGWGMLLLAIFLGVVVGRLLSMVARAIARRGQNRGWDTYCKIFESAAGPLYLTAITVGLTVGLIPISLSAGVREFANGVLKLLYIIAIGWFLFELAGLVDVLLQRFVHRSGSTFERQVIPLVRKTLRIFLVVVFVLFAAQNVFGADIGAWLAGLGIAGLAVSLAAQDSIKNVFGSLTIFMDKPFAVGERIVFDGHDGPVEEIGFRSTKIRTGAGDLVTVPNARIVDASVRNVGRRPNIPRTFTIGVTYDTPVDKVEEAIQIARDVLALPEVTRAFNLERNPPRVYFDSMSASSLDIKIWYWYFPGSDWWGYCEHAQRINLELLRRFGAAGIDFAFPTQTVFLAGDEKRKLSVVQEAGQEAAKQTGGPSA